MREQQVQQLRHPDGDSIDVAVIDGELIGVTIRQGPHELCKLALTHAEIGILIRQLVRARRKVKQR